MSCSRSSAGQSNVNVPSGWVGAQEIQRTRRGPSDLAGASVQNEVRPRRTGRGTLSLNLPCTCRLGRSDTSTIFGSPALSSTSVILLKCVARSPSSFTSNTLFFPGSIAGIRRVPLAVFSGAAPGFEDRPSDQSANTLARSVGLLSRSGRISSGTPAANLISCGPLVSSGTSIWTAST